MTDLSQSFGEVPVLGDWRDYFVSMRIHILYDKGELVHYVDGKPRRQGLHPLRHYFHISSSDIASHLAQEVKAWAILSGWSVEEIIMLLRTSLTNKQVTQLKGTYNTVTD